MHVHMLLEVRASKLSDLCKEKATVICFQLSCKMIMNSYPLPLSYRSEFIMWSSIPNNTIKVSSEFKWEKLNELREHFNGIV
jgi:hypothetical protein